MSKILTISPDKCTGCRSCELICSFSKMQAFNPKSSRVSVLAFEDMAVSVPIMCMQCEEPSCMKVCPVSAISKTPEGTVFIDGDKCIGCKMCVSACPLGNISFSTVEGKIVKCDLCEGDPKCAKYCPSGAIQYKEATPSNLSRRKLIAEKFKELFGEVTQ